jgi:hypothetical protein
VTAGFLEEPPADPEVQALYDEDVTETGYVWKASRLWAYQPQTLEHLFELMSETFKPSGQDFRQRGILSRQRPRPSVIRTAPSLGAASWQASRSRPWRRPSSRAPTPD